MRVGASRRTSRSSIGVPGCASRDARSMHGSLLLLPLTLSALAAGAFVPAGAAVQNPAAGAPAAVALSVQNFPYGALAGLAVATTCASKAISSLPKNTVFLYSAATPVSSPAPWLSALSCRTPGCAYVLLHLQQAWSAPAYHEPAGLHEVQVCRRAARLAGCITPQPQLRQLHTHCPAATACLRSLVGPAQPVSHCRPDRGA